MALLFQTNTNSIHIDESQCQRAIFVSQNSEFAVNKNSPSNLEKISIENIVIYTSHLLKQNKHTQDSFRYIPDPGDNIDKLDIPTSAESLDIICETGI